MQRFPVDSFPAQALQAVLDYLWDNESADYSSRSSQEKCGHIFAELKTLQAWLSNPKKKLDKAYHTVAPRCLQTMRPTSEIFPTSRLATFTKTYCAFANAIRLLARSVPGTTYFANCQGHQ